MTTAEAVGSARVTVAEADRNARRIFGGVTVGHLGIDIFNSMGPVLLAFLRDPLELTNGQIGLAIGLYQFLAGTTQPGFGWVIDRVGTRFIGPFSVAANLACIGLAVLAAATTGSFALFMVPFVLAAVASGAFHPVGVMHASTVNALRSSTFTAIFFFAGQVGIAAGPYLAGLALDYAGLDGIYWLLLFVVPVPLFMTIAMGPRRYHLRPPSDDADDADDLPELAGSDEQEEAASPVEAGAAPAASVRPETIGFLALVIATRSWAVFGTIAFLPSLLAQQGWSSQDQGLASGLFMLGGAMTAVVAGALADRRGNRVVVTGTLLGGAVFLYLLPEAGSWSFVVALVCGGMLGASHSILIVMAQEVLPWRRGLASGAVLGFVFATAAVATWSEGILADRYGLASALQWGAVVALVSAISSLFLPEPEREP